MPDIRSTANLNSIAMQGWVGSGESLNTYKSASTSAPTFVTINTPVDVPGTSLSVVVPSNNSTIIAIANADITIVSSGSNIICLFNWNSTNQSADLLFVNPGSTVTNRCTAGQSWVVTGVSAGTYTAKLQAQTSSLTAGNTVNTTNTTLTIMVIGGS